MQGFYDNSRHPPTSKTRLRPGFLLRYDETNPGQKSAIAGYTVTHMGSSTSGLQYFLSEARRRRLFPVAAMYIVGAWVILQVSDVLFPAWDIPDQAMQYVVYALLLGFPLALVFGWRYDIDGGRIRRTESVLPGDATAGSGLQRGDVLLLGLMLAGLLAIGYWLTGRVTGTDPEVLSGQPNSIAVLAFEGDVAQENVLLGEFADELVSALISVPGLKVTGRESSFYFKQRPDSLQRVSRLLDVRYLLTTEVQGSGDAARISLQLLRMPDASTMWATTLDAAPGPELDVLGGFRREIASAMGVSDRPAGAATGGPEVSQEAIDLERLAMRAADQGDAMRALELLDAALEADPDYASAHVNRALLFLLVYSHSGRPELNIMLQEVGRSLDAAQAAGAEGTVDYHYARALQTRRLINSRGSTPALEKQLSEQMEKTIALNPSDAMPYVSWSIHYRRQRDFNEATRLLETALDYDPLNSGALLQYSRSLSALGRKDEAFRTLQRLVELHGFGQQEMAFRHMEFQQLDQSMKWFRISGGNPQNRTRLMAGTWASMLAPERAIALWETIADDPVYGPTVSSYIEAIKGNYLAAYRGLSPNFDEAATGQAVNPDLANQAGDFALRAGLAEDAVRLIELGDPGLRDPVAPVVSEQNMRSAVNLACALSDLGGHEVRIGILVSQVLNHLRGRPAIGFDGTGTLAAEAFACQGDRDRAVAEFQRVFDEGLRDIYLPYGQTPLALDRLRGIDRFDDLLGIINTDLAAMRDRAIAMETAES
jgi:TolB-like protein